MIAQVFGGCVQCFYSAEEDYNYFQYLIKFNQFIFIFL